LKLVLQQRRKEH